MVIDYTYMNIITILYMLGYYPNIYSKLSYFIDKSIAMHNTSVDSSHWQYS